MSLIPANVDSVFLKIFHTFIIFHFIGKLTPLTHFSPVSHFYIRLAQTESDFIVTAVETGLGR